MRTPQLDQLLSEFETRTRAPDVNTILVGNDGKPLTPARLTKAVGEVRDSLSIVHIDADDGTVRAKHLHDARGTFATRLMTLTEVPLTDQEIADVMGWSPDQVAQIRRHYVDHRAVVVAMASRIRRSAVN